MRQLTEIVVSLASAIAAGALVFIALELQRLRQSLENWDNCDKRPHHPQRPTRNFLSSVAHGVSPRETQTGFAIYVFRDGHWHLEADLSAPGCESSPPSITGSYHGQVVRKESHFRK